MQNHAPPVQGDAQHDSPTSRAPARRRAGGDAGTAAAHPARHSGQHRPIVFVHGSAGSAQQYQTQAKRFASNGYPAALVEAHEYDHGRGVPEASVGGLSTRVWRQRHRGSVGLGLWIVRELARAHGGDLTYAPDHPGASFVITLPRRAPAQPKG